jgi:hypothetical protein
MSRPGRGIRRGGCGAGEQLGCGGRAGHRGAGGPIRRSSYGGAARSFPSRHRKPSRALRCGHRRPLRHRHRRPLRHRNPRTGWWLRRAPGTGSPAWCRFLPFPARAHPGFRRCLPRPAEELIPGVVSLAARVCLLLPERGVERRARPGSRHRLGQRSRGGPARGQGIRGGPGRGALRRLPPGRPARIIRAPVAGCDGGTKARGGRGDGRPTARGGRGHGGPTARGGRGDGGPTARAGPGGELARRRGHRSGRVAARVKPGRGCATGVGENRRRGRRPRGLGSRPARRRELASGRMPRRRQEGAIGRPGPRRRGGVAAAGRLLPVRFLPGLVVGLGVARPRVVVGSGTRPGTRTFLRPSTAHKLRSPSVFVTPGPAGWSPSWGIGQATATTSRTLDLAPYHRRTPAGTGSARIGAPRTSHATRPALRGRSAAQQLRTP